MSKDDKEQMELAKKLEEKEYQLQAQCAISLVKSKIQIINSELSLESHHKVITNIQDRIKATESVCQKLKKKGIAVNYDNAVKYISDYVGVRAVCAFADDIYKVADILLKHPDVKLVKRKDYIKNPKKSGYRSLHLIIQVPIHLSTGDKWIKVELQLRTSAMNFWADMDHQLRYKKGAKEAGLIGKELKAYAAEIKELDDHMVELRKKIEAIS